MLRTFTQFQRSIGAGLGRRKVKVGGESVKGFSAGFLGLALGYNCLSCVGVFAVLPPAVSALLGSASVVGFSGSRSVAPCPALVCAVVAALPPGCAVSVGCASGADAAFRVARPGASVFRVASFGRGRGAFAARSVACVRSVAVPGGVWVSFPAGACPAGLVPSSSSSRAFCGLGSGSWASLSFAVGLGVPCAVWLPAGLVVPAGWGFSSVGGGWWLSAASGCQLALF